jgi:ABC-type bacteriocin/lantibiotic exporter with double-glycine peptidase domain
VSARARDEERGDVPGWILIAIMSAGLVVLIWALAGPLLTQVFEDAVNRVTSNF